MSFFKLIFGLLNGWLSFLLNGVTNHSLALLFGGTWGKYCLPALWFVIWTRSLQDLCETLAWKFFQATSLHSSRAPMSNLQAVYRWCSMRPELCVLPEIWYLGPTIFSQKWSKCFLGLRTCNQPCISRVLISKCGFLCRGMKPFLNVKQWKNVELSSWSNHRV